MSQFIAKSERPALHVCRKDKDQEQSDLADETAHIGEFNQESTGKQFQPFLLIGI